MKKIIINADDFGLTTGCNLGIIKALKKGIVTSKTIMMHMPITKISMVKVKIASKSIVALTCCFFILQTFNFIDQILF
ncbi:MAG: ChbG/HpnK family deacetylase [Clostridiaceae bacterium]|nr:ChbG/HpnK family deacetylase [Clostridiaceae bacterium]